MSTITQRYSLLPKTWEEAVQFSKTLSKSNLCPKNYRHRPDDILIAIQMGSEIGLPPLQALHTITMVDGQPCLCGDAALSLVQASGELESIEETVEGNSDDSAVATCAIKRKGMKKMLKRQFSAEEAKQKGIWEQIASLPNPQQGLSMGARALSLKAGFSDVFKGLNILTAAMQSDQKNSVDDKNSILTVSENMKGPFLANVVSNLGPMTLEEFANTHSKMDRKTVSSENSSDTDVVTPIENYIDHSDIENNDIEDSDIEDVESDIERELAQREVLSKVRADSDKATKALPPDLEIQLETVEKIDKVLKGFHDLKLSLLKGAIGLTVAITSLQFIIVKFFT